MGILGLPCASIRASRSILFLSPICPRISVVAFCSATDFADSIAKDDSKRVIRSSLYSLINSVSAIRVLRSADVILSEDSRHSGKLLQYYNIKAQLVLSLVITSSMAQRELAVLTRLKQGEIVALISDAGTPGISDPGTQLQCVIAREITKLHEEVTSFITPCTTCNIHRLFLINPLIRDALLLKFWRGSLGEAKQEFHIRQPKGEITLLIEGKEETKAENPTESQLEEELKALISDGHSLSSAVKIVAERTSMRRKEVYSLALNKLGKQIQVEDDAKE